MRRFLLSLIVVASLPTLTACNDGDKPLFMILNYQVSCANTGGCSGIPPRMIETLDGEEGNEIFCSLTDAGGDYLLDLSFSNISEGAANEYGLELRNTVVPMAGGPARNGTLTVTEESSDYEGRVGGSPPPDTCAGDPPTMCEIPCRVYDIMFADSPNGPTIQGSIQCVGLPLGLDPTIAREVHMPSDRNMPATFLVENCAGQE
jgi:hypothetical protein